MNSKPASVEPQLTGSPRPVVAVLFGVSRRIIGLSLACVVLALLGFKVSDNFADKTTPFTPTETAKAVVVGNTAFALDLYKNLKDTPGNIFFSPFSISTGLAMTYAGARGQTATEMARVAHFGIPQTELTSCFGDLLQRVDTLQHWRHVTLISANGLWRQADHSFAEPFLDLLHSHYRAEARTAHFDRNGSAVAANINAWARRRTRGRITTIVQPGKLDLYSRLVLCNAIYFKGQWKSHFEKRNTHPAPFYVSSTQSVSVPMMVQTGKLKTAWVADPSATLLELPYYGGDLSMVIILPQERDGLAELEQVLTPEALDSWLADLDQDSAHETYVHLPRFAMRQGFDLKPLLCSMGLRTAFGEQADLSGMDGTTNLYLSDALHQARVDVNESGTEAAAVTLFHAKSRGGPTHFMADHPFLFLIRDRGSRTILFLGRLTDSQAAPDKVLGH